MELKRNFTNCFFVILWMGTFIISSCEAYKFNVGGKNGLWVVKPSENYNHWAERMRFQVNDTLYFKYKKGSDSVLVVTKDNYFSCNNKKPVQSLTDGESVFCFDHSGPYFFISGNADNCNKGQKLIVVVMAVRNKSQHHEAPPSPCPVSCTPPASSPQPSASSPPTSPASPRSSVPPPVESPRSSPSPMQPPEPSDIPSDFGAPAPAPTSSGSSGLGCNIGLVLGFSVGVTLVLGSFIG
ncbi:hypothetical protein AB3S75_009760 [Citrus x aurantiifolia]